MNEPNNFGEKAFDETIRENSEVNATISVKCTKKNEEISEESSNLSSFEKFINWIVENVKKIFNIITCSMISLWEPAGYSNKKGYCYLNSVVQLLVSCEDFSKYIESYDWLINETTSDTKFVEGLFGLIRATKQNDIKQINLFLTDVQNYCTESSYGDDVYKCFMNTLSRINKVFQKYNIETEISSPLKKNQISKFLLDNFYGEIQFQKKCKKCKEKCCKTVQWLKSLPLPVPNSKSPVSLETCVNLFFKEEEVILNEPMKCQCPNGSMEVKSISKLNYGPKYLFVYLNRGSYGNEEKNCTFVTCDKLALNLKTIDEGEITYNLIAVLDHESFFNFGHYYCKCNYEQDKWWLLNDSRVSLCKPADIITKNTIAFMFKKRPKN